MGPGKSDSIVELEVVAPLVQLRWVNDAMVLEAGGDNPADSPRRENGAIDWFGTDPAAWAQSPDRGASIALWRLDSDTPMGFSIEPFVDAHMICVHLSGTMDWSARLNDRSYRAPCDANTFCLARAGEEAEVEYANARLSFAHFYLPVRWFESDMVDVSSKRCGSAIELIDPMNATSFEVAGLARQAITAMRAGGPAARLKIDAATIELAAALVRDHSTAVPSRLARGGLPPGVLRRVTDYLIAHIADEVTLADLASLAGVSAPHFCRAFARSTGVSPHRYQIALRLDRATRLLEDRALSIADVGYAVGYDDPSYFSRLFAHQTGMSPRAWRAERWS
ncbi:AraC family transcriptional regulator [Sphingomonas koreensis]|nr:AraC family transcriptional regulator [Sphingomonas koreensis]